MPWTELETPRGADDAGELALSREERALEAAWLRRPEVHAIRRRYRVVRAARELLGGRSLTPAELDVLLPREPRRAADRIRAGLPTDCVHGHRLTPQTTHFRPDGRIICRICAARANAAARLRRRGFNP